MPLSLGLPTWVPADTRRIFFVISHRGYIVFAVVNQFDTHDFISLSAVSFLISYLYLWGLDPSEELLIAAYGVLIDGLQ